MGATWTTSLLLAVSNRSAPICGEDQWAPVDVDEGGEMRFMGRGPEDNLIRGIAVFLMTCRQCAFVSAHAYDIITGKAEYGGY